MSDNSNMYLGVKVNEGFQLYDFALALDAWLAGEDCKTDVVAVVAATHPAMADWVERLINSTMIAALKGEKTGSPYRSIMAFLSCMSIFQATGMPVEFGTVVGMASFVRAFEEKYEG